MAPDFLLHLTCLTPGASWQAGARSQGVLQRAPEQIIGGLGLKREPRSTGMRQQTLPLESCALLSCVIDIC